jgi:hypothetical protein
VLLAVDVFRPVVDRGGALLIQDRSGHLPCFGPVRQS